jgi:hypothetical protein
MKAINVMRLWTVLEGTPMCSCIWLGYSSARALAWVALHYRRPSRVWIEAGGAPATLPGVLR